MGFAFSMLLPSCDVKPRVLQPGKDNCDYCQMTVSDLRFGAELITRKGKIYVFDDAHCVIAFIKEKQKVVPADIRDIYISDYSGDHRLVNVNEMHLYNSEELRSPMGGNIAAFSSLDSLHKYMANMKGERVIWDDIVK
jgi:copper chaperone NosL